MAKLDSKSSSSIFDFVKRQREIEDRLLRDYAPSPQRPKKGSGKQPKPSADPYAHLPPDFVPIQDRFPRGINKKGNNHTSITICEFEGHRKTGEPRWPIDISSSDVRGPAKNGPADLSRYGLSTESEENAFERDVQKRFNASFADHGNIDELALMLDSLDSVVIPSVEIGGVTTPKFNGSIDVLYDGDKHYILIQNELELYSPAIGMVLSESENPKGSFPTFKSHTIDFDEEDNGLPPKEMLSQRKELAKELGLPLHLTQEEIREVWTEHLEASYNLWATQTEALCASAGVKIKIPPLSRALAEGNDFDLSNQVQGNFVDNQIGTGK